MLFINLKSRFRNKAFILAMVGAIVLLIQQLGFNIIPNNYSEIVNTVLTILTMLGIVVDTSTSGISDQVVPNLTVQAINKANKTKEQVKTEDSTTGINGVITENSQIGSDDASANASDKESETNSGANISSNVQVSTVQPVDEEKEQLKAENEQLKATLNQIQSVVADNIIAPSNS